MDSPELAAALPKLLPRGFSVLDLGCGRGYYVAEMKKEGYEVHGVEGTVGIEQIAFHAPIHQADLSEARALSALGLPRGHVLSLEVAEHLAREDEVRPTYLCFYSHRSAPRGNAAPLAVPGARHSCRCAGCRRRTSTTCCSRWRPARGCSSRGRCPRRASPGAAMAT